MADLSGASLCDAVRYTIVGGPHSSGICPCRRYQRSIGTAFSVVMIVPESNLFVGDLLNPCEDREDSGKPAHRRFCGTCGAPGWTDADAMPGTVFVKAGTSDDTSVLNSSTQIYCENVTEWARFVQGTQNFPGAMEG